MDQTDHLNISQEMIDRLVDGELDEPVRSLILRRMEHDVSLCRRIAMAFLENQTWREVFSNQSLLSPVYGNAPTGERAQSRYALPVASQNGGEGTLTSGPASSVEQRQRRRKYAPLLWVSAIAASFILTFLGAWYVQSLLLRNGTRISGVPSAPKNGLLAEGSPQDEEIKKQFQPLHPQLEMVSVPLPTDEAGTVATLDVPLLFSSGGPITEMIPAGMLPAEVLDSLAAEGHIVEQERRFVPVALPDGRDSIVPIDQVKIRFVGGSER